MKGKILISSPSLLNDLVFYKSIILIVDKTDDDITGFILNRSLNQFLTKNLNSSEKIKVDLYYGGPVSSEHYFIIKSRKNILGLINIYDNLYWGNDIELLFIQLKKGNICNNDFILFEGYSGWNVKQLDNEIYNRNWTVLDKKVNEIFGLKKKNSWNVQAKKLGEKYSLWYNSPDDITLN